MRKPIIAGNWKMFKTVAESVSFVHELAPRLAPFTGVERVVCPTFVALASVSNALKATDIRVGAQSVHWEAQGAFTSQIAPTMLQGIAEYVIIGHSECRAYLNETDETVNLRLKAAQSNGLIPILCVGETKQQRDAGKVEQTIINQLKNGLIGVDRAKLVVAYEPIWAIGTGETCEASEANRVIGLIRAQLDNSDVTIQYGGSVKPSNISEIMAQPEIDGVLVGGASLAAADFAGIVNYK